MWSQDDAYLIFIFIAGAAVNIIVAIAIIHDWLNFYWHQGGSIRKAVQEKLYRIRERLKI